MKMSQLSHTQTCPMSRLFQRCLAGRRHYCDCNSVLCMDICQQARIRGLVRAGKPDMLMSRQSTAEALLSPMTCGSSKPCLAQHQSARAKSESSPVSPLSTTSSALLLLSSTYVFFAATAAARRGARFGAVSVSIAALGAVNSFTSSC